MPGINIIKYLGNKRLTLKKWGSFPFPKLTMFLGEAEETSSTVKILVVQFP